MIRVNISWDFGDSAGSSTAQNPTYTYVAEGIYNVTLTVTDDGGLSDTALNPVSVTEPVTGGITLSATGYKVRGLQKADLAWDGATTNVDIRRHGSTIAAGEPNDGAYTDNIDQRGGASYIYEVCETGTTTCSNQATITF